MDEYLGVIISIIVLVLVFVLSGFDNIVAAAALVEDTHNVVNSTSSPTLIWPIPLQFTSSNETIALHPHMRLTYRYSRGVMVNTIDDSHDQDMNFRKDDDETSYDSPILNEALDRYRKLIFREHKPIRSYDDAPVLLELTVLVHSFNETLRFGVDESYQLAVPDPSNSTRARIEANTVYGALRGLETFSQLCSYDFTSRVVQVKNAPWMIFDEPRFPYRGLLIDTARHYQPLQVIRNVIDAMAYSKLNILHWHIVDTQSFPLEIPSYPKLWKGSYSEIERYTIEDAKAIVEYAQKRGIHVMAELDVPGHAQSWGFGYPQLWPSSNCTQPLDVSQNFTFQLIDGIVSDFSKVFPFNMVHMGGDEVNTSCWTNTSHVNDWLSAHNLTAFDAYKYFVLRAEEISLSNGYTPVNWEEPFNNFGSELNKRTIIHNWLGPGVAPKVVKAGFRCIVSNQDAWYLDHVDVTWDKFYTNEPLVNITDKEEQKLVIGGEVCMWAERVDASDIEQTIWPRAAAAAERLWSSIEHIGGGGGAESSSTVNMDVVLRRLRYFRCLLNQRGVAAAPVVGKGRDPPIGPDSCYSQ